MEKYEVVDTITGERFEFIGVSNEQKYSFDYRVTESFINSVHISHINKDMLIVYDKRYILTNDDAWYFYKDLGGIE